MRSYIFTEAERRRLRRWLKTGEEDWDLSATLHLFVNFRCDVNIMVIPVTG